MGSSNQGVRSPVQIRLGCFSVLGVGERLQGGKPKTGCWSKTQAEPWTACAGPCASARAPLPDPFTDGETKARRSAFQPAPHSKGLAVLNAGLRAPPCTGAIPAALAQEKGPHAASSPSP